jgi:hypothetical protein
MSRSIRMLAAATTAGGVALLGLMTAGAASAGTLTQGSWTFAGPETSSSSYSAQVQQPINADGSSVFNNKGRTVPVQFKVTRTDTTGFKFESVVGGDSGQTPSTSGVGENDYSVAHLTMPAGVTVNDLTGLTSDFSWAFGENHSGGFRWQVETTYNGQPANIMVDYGDASNSLQSGTAGSGVNMINSSLANQNRDESQQVGGTLYTPWSYVQANFGSMPVNGIDLVVDGGWGTSANSALATQTHDQVINLTDAVVTWNGGSSTFTMPNTTTTTTQDNSQPAYVYLSKVSGATPTSNIDESTLTSTQGDSGGQYRQVDGKYMYNLPIAGLDTTATYEVGVSFQSNGNNPIPATVQFGLK